MFEVQNGAFVLTRHRLRQEASHPGEHSSRAAFLFILGLADTSSRSPVRLPDRSRSISIAPRAKSTSPWVPMLHTVHGTFEVKEGMLQLDVASGKISGRVVVDVKKREHRR